MASALNVPLPNSVADGVFHSLPKDTRAKQQSIAEITEMIHVASLLQDDVLDDAETRRGIGSLNFVMGNKVAVLAGDFLLSRASVALASLKNTEVQNYEGSASQIEMLLGEYSWRRPGKSTFGQPSVSTQGAEDPSSEDH